MKLSAMKRVQKRRFRSKSDARRLELYRGRKQKRVRIWADEVEPRSKKMPVAARVDFQRRVLRDLRSPDRSAFKGPIALDLRLSTTRHDAPQAHTIAKNLLDLLSTPEPTLGEPPPKLLYDDDGQIHALSVSCVHGEEHPNIMVIARSLPAFLGDLALAADALRHLDQDDPSDWQERDRGHEEIRHFRDLIDNEASHRRRLGDSLYDAFFKMTRWSAQRTLLSHASLTTAQLDWLFDVPKTPIANPFPAMWDQMVRESSLRMQVGELPTKSGESAPFKKQIEKSAAAFKAKRDWLISPLVVPVALQVVVRPSPSTPKGALHDLDNIVRDYLLPKIVPTFGTVTDHRWTIDFEELRRTDPNLAARWGDNPTPPKGTRSGVTRYEALRLPPAKKGEKGFVSVAIVLEDSSSGDVFHQIDDQIEKVVCFLCHSERAHTGRMPEL
jgi:hypothetical protein